MSAPLAAPRFDSGDEVPTGDWYREAAATLEGVAGDVLEAGREAEANWDDGVAIGCVVATTIDRALSATSANCAAVAAELHQQAEECLRRAQVCDEFAADVAAYEADLARYHEDVAAYGRDPTASVRGDAPYPRRPSPPHRPASWVDVPVGAVR